MLIAAGFAAVSISLPTLLGKKRTHDPVKDSPYECGMPPLTEAHTRFSVKFYLIAMLFILFDIEVVFFLGWAAVFRDLIKPGQRGRHRLGDALWGAGVFGDPRSRTYLRVEEGRARLGAGEGKDQSAKSEI